MTLLDQRAAGVLQAHEVGILSHRALLLQVLLRLCCRQIACADTLPAR